MMVLHAVVPNQLSPLITSLAFVVGLMVLHAVVPKFHVQKLCFMPHHWSPVIAFVVGLMVLHAVVPKFHMQKLCFTPHHWYQL